jgi:hypothetical protein
MTLCKKLAVWIAALLFSVAAAADTVTNLGFPQPQAGGWIGMGATPTITTYSTTLPDGTTGNAAQFIAHSNGDGITTSTRNVSVTAGQWYTVSFYVQYWGGAVEAAVLVNPQVFGQPSNSPYQGAIFDASHCTFESNFGGYSGTYMVGAVAGQPTWCRASITFQATATGAAKAAIVSEWNPATFNVWGYDFIAGPYTARHIDTTTGSASGTNQSNPNSDTGTNWSAAGLGQYSVFSINGRTGDSSSVYFGVYTTGGIGLYTNVSVNTSQPVYQYAYASKIGGGAVLASSVAGFPGNNNNGNIVGVTSNFSTSPCPSATCFDAGNAWLIGGTSGGTLAQLILAPGGTVPQHGYLGFSGNGGNIYVGRVGVQVGGIFP